MHDLECYITLYVRHVLYVYVTCLHVHACRPPCRHLFTPPLPPTLSFLAAPTSGRIMSRVPATPARTLLSGSAAFMRCDPVAAATASEAVYALLLRRSLTATPSLLQAWMNLAIPLFRRQLPLDARP
jgi:hypothetical protein